MDFSSHWSRLGHASICEPMTDSDWPGLYPLPIPKDKSGVSPVETVLTKSESGVMS